MAGEEAPLYRDYVVTLRAETKVIVNARTPGLAIKKALMTQENDLERLSEAEPHLSKRASKTARAEFQEAKDNVTTFLGSTQPAAISDVSLPRAVRGVCLNCGTYVIEGERFREGTNGLLCEGCGGDCLP